MELPAYSSLVPTYQQRAAPPDRWILIQHSQMNEPTMIHRIILAVGLVTASIAASQTNATAGDPYGTARVRSHNHSMNRPWHGNYYNQMYGQPLALIVPPTASMRQTLSWGVSQNLMYPIQHQFGRSANSPGAARGHFYGTPRWPSHTDQFGTYYVRGPW